MSFRKVLRGTPDPSRALTNLLRFLESGFSTTLLREFAAHPPLLVLAANLFAQSQYLADILVRDPELFSWLTTTEVLDVPVEKGALLEEMRRAMSLFGRRDKKLDALRRAQRRILLRVGTREIVGKTHERTITEELSVLAECTVQAAVELAWEHAGLGAMPGIPDTLAVIGLGKLGGNELNFSSDIDLLFVYDQDGELPVAVDRLHTRHELFVRVAGTVVQLLSEAGSEGHLYRVDMRLRPDGHAGPLAMSRPSYLAYYETRGELWERQMLVKGRVVAGDEATGASFLSDLLPFVFPRTHLANPLDEIARIKARIEGSLGERTDIKLGAGGIRDIEFLVQALQLLHAGVAPELRRTNTLAALEALWDNRLLSDLQHGWLAEAYVFFRRVEHRLQLLHGRQTHALPTSDAELKSLSRSLGFRSPVSFRRVTTTHRKHVRRIFDEVFHPSRPVPRRARAEKSRARVSRSLPGSAAIREQVERLRGELRSIVEDAQIERIVGELMNLGAPAWGAKNLLLLVQSDPIRRSLVAALRHQPFVQLLLTLCSRSSYLAELCSREPLLFETMIGQPDELFRTEWGWGFLKDHDPHRFKLYNEFRNLMVFVLHRQSIAETTSNLSKLSEELMRDQLDRLWEEGGQGKGLRGLCLVSLGKLGGGELTLMSDLDCYVIYEGEDTARAERLVQQFVKVMTSIGSYTIDLRLRPEGKNAPVSAEFSYFADYLATRASLWERQSLVKARVIWGEASLRRRLEELISRFAYDEPLPPDWLRRTRAMRREMEVQRSGGRSLTDLKVGRGGLVDLEFAIQTAQLRAGGRLAAVREQNSLRAVGLLKQQAVIPRRDADRLARNLVFLRTLETLLRLNGQGLSTGLPSDKELLRAVASGLGERTEKTLRNRVDRIRRENRGLFDRMTRGRT